MRKKIFTPVILAMINIILVAGMLITIPLYISANRKKQTEKSELSALYFTMSVSDSVNIYFNQQLDSLEGKKKYLLSLRGEGKGRARDALNYLYASNGAENDYQLILSQHEGYLLGYCVAAPSGITEVSYSRSSYSDSVALAYENILNAQNEEIFSHPQVTSAFVNPTDTKKSVAFYTRLDLIDSAGEAYPALLMAIIPLSELFGSKLPVVLYENAGGAVINRQGGYIVNTDELRSTNLYEHLISAFGLSYPQAMEIQEQIRQKKIGSFELADSRGDNYLFCYCSIQEMPDWFYVSKIPASSLAAENIDVLFTIIITAFILLLALFDGGYMLSLNKSMKKSLEDVRVAKENAEAANSAKSTFLSRMSHEIRTPLNAVNGYMIIARRNLENTGKVMDCISKTEVSAKHLLNVINDILDVSAIESGKMKITLERFNFQDLLCAVTAMFYSMACAKNVNFSVILDGKTDEYIFGDEKHINQILINLLNNAVKFTPEGGKVSLGVKTEPMGENKSLVTFRVEDNGIGMSAEFIENIWEPFEQADSSISRRFGGTGLGLTITKNLIDLMEGEIFVESVLGEGSLFTVKVTLERGDGEKSSSKALSFSNLKVLIIDAEDQSAQYHELLFNNMGISCECFNNEEDALLRARRAYEAGERFDLVLMDTNISEAAVILAVEGFNDIFSLSPPEIALTAYDLTDCEEKARNLGVKHFWVKPLFLQPLRNLMLSLSFSEDKEENISIQHETEEIRLDGIHILLAEDNQTNMEIAVDLLEMAGAQVEGAADGKEALEKFEASAPGDYQAILMDIQMPVMDGYRATKAIRACSHIRAKDIPIIAMSANAFSSDISEAIACGMNDYIAKPVDDRKLYEVLSKYI